MTQTPLLKVRAMTFDDWLIDESRLPTRAVVNLVGITDGIGTVYRHRQAGNIAVPFRFDESTRITADIAVPDGHHLELKAVRVNCPEVEGESRSVSVCGFGWDFPTAAQLEVSMPAIDPTKEDQRKRHWIKNLELTADGPCAGIVHYAIVKNED